jgi:hypothetical protein
MPRKKQSAKEYEKVMPFSLPSEENWEEATRTLGLSEAGKACLMDLLLEIDADIRQQRLYFSNRLTRDKRIKKLKEVEKAAKAFRAVLIENEKQLPDFIPHRALEDIGQLFTFLTINEVTGRDVRSLPQDEGISQLLKKYKIAPVKLTEAEMRAADQESKRDAGLVHADKLIVHMLNKLIEPIDAWHEARRSQNKGGRTSDRYRRAFIHALARKAGRIIGEKPSADVKSRFFDLCELVFDICGVPCENLKNLIGEVLGDERPLSFTFYL